jgi:hypothetical protein
VVVLGLFLVVVQAALRGAYKEYFVYRLKGEDKNEKGQKLGGN